MAAGKPKDLRELTDEELMRRRDERQNDITQFNLQIATGVVDNVRSKRENRREIARINTILRERELAAKKAAQRS